jgi:hypothetical protein
MVKIKSMTWAQVKALREAGLDMAFSDGADRKKNVEALEWVFIHVYPELAGDDSIPYEEVIDIAAKTYTKTYGRGAEVKN